MIYLNKKPILYIIDAIIDFQAARFIKNILTKKLRIY